MGINQIGEQTDTPQIFQDGSPATTLTKNLVRLSIFLMGLDDNPETLCFLVHELLGIAAAEQVVCLSTCRRYVVDPSNLALKVEHGILLSVNLQDTRESELAVKAWAIRAAKEMGAEDLRIVVHEIGIFSALEQNSDAIQLSFDDLSAGNK